MGTKKHNLEAFMISMFGLASSMKRNTESCCELIGKINERELFILTYVGRNENVKMKDISDFLGIPLSTCTSIVDRMIEQSMLSRQHSNEDRRVINVTLGKHGKLQFSQFVNEKMKCGQSILDEFSKKDQLILIEMLTKMARAIEKSA